MVFSVGKLWKRDIPDSKGDRKRERLDTKLADVNDQAEQEIKEARKVETEVSEKLKKVQEVEDDSERLKQLARLFNETRRR